MAAAPGASDISPLLAGLVRSRVSSGVVTESALAALVGASQSTLANWLGGRKRLGVGLCDSVMAELGLCLAEVLASVPAPPRVGPARGVLLVMPGPHKARRPWRRRVDPERIAADFLDEDAEDGEAS